MFDRGLAVPGADRLDLQRALGDVDRNRTAQLGGGGAHVAQQLRLAGIHAMRSQPDPDAAVRAPIVAVKHLDCALKAGIGSRPAIGGTAVGIDTGAGRRPLIGAAIGANAHPARHVEEKILIDAPHVQDGRRSCHDQLEDRDFDDRALLVPVQHLDRHLAHRQQEAVDIVAAQRRFADVFDESPEHRRAEAVIVDVDEPRQHQGLIEFDRVVGMGRTFAGDRDDGGSLHDDIPVFDDLGPVPGARQNPTPRYDGALASFHAIVILHSRTVTSDGNRDKFPAAHRPPEN